MEQGSSSGFARRYVELIFRRPFAMLAVIAVIGVVTSYIAGRIPLLGDFVELLPQHAPEVKDLNLVKQMAGGDGYLVIQVKGAPLPTLEAFAQKLAPQLDELKDDVRYVEYKYDIDFFKDRALWLLPSAKLSELHDDLAARIRYEKQKANPLFVELTDDQPLTFEQIEHKYSGDVPRSDYVTSQDGKELYLFVKPNGFSGDLDFAKRLTKDVSSVCQKVAKDFPGVQTALTGAYQIRPEEDAVMKKDVIFATILSTLVAVGLILLATRRPSSILVVMIPVTVGLAITFTTVVFTIGHLNVVTGFLAAILIGLGIEYGVHLSMRYLEERREHDAKESMVNAIRGTFAGAMTSAVTNAAAFFVLVFAKFTAFTQFGWISGLGVMLTVFAAYLIGPPIIVVAEKIRPIKPLPPEHLEELQNRRYRRWPTSLIVGIALSVVAFTVYSAFMTRHLSFESDLRKLKGESPATKLDEHVAQQIGVQITPAVLFVNGIGEAQKLRDLIEQVRARHPNDSAFHKAASINDLIPPGDAKELEARHQGIEKLRALLNDLPESVKTGEKGQRLNDFRAMLDSKPWGHAQLPEALWSRFVAGDLKTRRMDGTYVLLFPRYGNYDTNQIKAWGEQLDEVRGLANAQKVEVHILDGNLIAARVFALVRGDGPFILWAAALVVFVAIVISMRSFKEASLVAGPLFLGMVCLAGGLYLTGVHLNFMNAVVLPNLLAIAVDNSVHLFHRYKEEGRGSLGHVVRHTGWAAVVATISNAAGYGALLTARHQGLRSIGQLAVLGVACTFMGTTILFPALLALIERWTERREAKGAGVVEALTLPARAEATTEPAPDRRSA